MRRNMAQQPHHEEESSIDITPMLDVVFIMLIFFIVTATFVKEAGTEVERPEAMTGLRQEKANILIAITGDDEIWIDGNPVDEQEIQLKIETLHAENPQGSVVIQADRESTTEILMKVMDAARGAEVPSVAVATET